MRILLIEDEKRLSESIKKGFTELGFAIDQAFDGGQNNKLIHTIHGIGYVLTEKNFK